MNHNFATVDSSNRIVYAPDTLGRSLRAPTPWQYHAAGYWQVDDFVPDAPEGQYANPTGLWDIVTIQEGHVPAINEETGEPLDPTDEYKPEVNVVRQRYEFVPIPPAPPSPPKRYSKMKFTIALARRGILAGWDEFASSTEILSGLTVKRILDEATWMQSDDKNFTAILDAVKARFGAEVIDAVLAESEDEEW